MQASLHLPTRERWIALGTLGGLIAGGLAYLLGSPVWADLLWALTTAVALVPLLLSIVASLRRRQLGVDLIALLAMGVALALGEYLAGAVVALMLAGGEALERYAAGRARRELAALLTRAPAHAHRYEDGRLATIAAEAVIPGDRLLVKSGEVVPVDGVISRGPAVLDEANLTGEARPVERVTGEQVRSGAVNAGAPFDLRATTAAAESTYSRIVRLVEAAQAERAPFVRLADRYAMIFLPLTLAVAGGAWLVSADPIRALAVLVVATPCPLILAAPIAILGGLSRAASRGVLIKGGGALETLAEASIAVLDKTGTITAGAPRVAEASAFGGLSEDELVRLAASLDQVSPHVFAPAILAAARERELRLSFPEGPHEEPGSGISGRVEGREVAVGRLAWLTGASTPASEAATALRRRAAVEGRAAVFVAVDGVVQGGLLLEDPLRSDARRTMRALRRAGIKRIVLLTGDHRDVAEAVGLAVGADEVLAERSPEGKVEAVRVELAAGTTLMVGDGVNDAPALAAAHVGVAMGARGATASAEAADVVLSVDRLERLAEAMAIAQRARGIAVQSVLVGMGLSLVAMGAAAAGYLAPVAGALLQEGIDVLAILNALRALGRRGYPVTRVSPLGEQLRSEHRELLPAVERLRSTADRLDSLSPDQARGELEAIRHFLEEHLLPHERREDKALHAAVGDALRTPEATVPMSREHLEIAHRIRMLGRTLDEIGEAAPSSQETRDLRRILYGLHAILHLHFAQEEEHYLPLLDERAGEAQRTLSPEEEST